MTDTCHIEKLTPDHWRYTPKDNPDAAFEFTRHTLDTHSNSIEWLVYRPEDTHPEMIRNKQKLEVLNRICCLLPRIQIPRSTPGIDLEHDYPKLKVEALSLSGCDIDILGRPIFIIGSVAFFRRFNDDWNGEVFYSNSTLNDTEVSWRDLVTYEVLAKLEQLLLTRKLTDITRNDIFSC